MLLSAQLSLNRFDLRRLILAQLPLSCATVCALALGDLKWLHLPLLLLSGAIATGEKRPGRIAQAALVMLAGGALGAGFHMLGGGILSALTGCTLLLWLLRRHRHLNYRWNIEIQVEKNGRAAAFPALIDTGNRLREHESGLPVLIVEAGAVEELADAISALPDCEFRFLPYGVLGSCGSIRCFRPDRVRIIVPQIGARTAPACYMAIFPGRIPGSTRALAPPEFAFTAQGEPGFIYKLLKRARRFDYGIYKRKAIHLRHGGAIPQRLRLLHRRQRSATAAADP